MLCHNVDTCIILSFSVLSALCVSFTSCAQVIRSDGGSLAIPVPTVVQAIRAPPTPWAVTLLPHLQSSEPAILYGPLTIAEGVYNGYYRDIQQMTADIIPILQREVLTLAANGVNHIKIVETAMSSALLSKEGFRDAKENIKIMFVGCPSHVKKEIDFGNCDINTSDLEELDIYPS